MSVSGLQAALDLMDEDGASLDARSVFSHYYEVLASGQTGLIPEDTLVPYTDPVDARSLRFSEEEQREAVSKFAMIRLNGGLGTSMGLSSAKTLITVRDGLNFLDLIVAQVLSDRERFGAQIPLIFMDSYSTDAQTLQYLSRYPNLPVDGLPLSFLQSREPRLHASDLTPLLIPEDPDAQWCPPGHGDLYPSLRGSGLLDLLLEKGFRYAQVANGDNLGAALDPNLAAWFVKSGSPFVMEVCERTANDRKGGHLARSAHTGRLVLREIAQTPEADIASFQDVQRHRFFNTNTIWLDLQALRGVMEKEGAVLGLPMIRNVKHVPTGQGEVTEAVQIETAMGSAIEVFEGAEAVRVSRDRFLPVKTTNELLLVRSDLYKLNAQSRLVPTSENTPKVSLDPAFYAHFQDFEARIPNAPSLIEARSLSVEGDWRFLRDVSVQGNVMLPPPGGVYGTGQ